MSYDISLNKIANVVVVRVEGVLNNDIRKGILRDLDAEMKTHSCFKAIIDLTRSRFDSAEPVEGAVELTMYMNSIRMNRNSKLAFVYVDAEKPRKTFEKMSQKFGYQLRYFKDFSAAYDWLGEA